MKLFTLFFILASSLVIADPEPTPDSFEESSLPTTESAKGDEKALQNSEQGAKQAAKMMAPLSNPEGKKDVARINKTIMKYKGKIRGCYDKGLAKNPELKGKVSVNFTISVAGKVSNAKIKESTLNDETVENCIVAEVTKFKFTNRTQLTEVVSYPFYLNPAK